MGKRISIIIPIYNSDHFLPKCLESILQQVDTNDEIILVDDASTDKSVSVCNYYKKNNSIIRIIRKEQHTGPSDSRNIGIKNASGRFLAFVDSDDWLAPSALNDMYLFATKNNCEIVQTAFYYAYDEYLLLDKKFRKVYPQPIVISKERAMAHLVKDEIVKNFVWGKLYDTALIKKYLFPTNVNMGEDLYWQHRVVHGAENVGLLPIPLYYYRQNPQSLSNVFSEKHITLLEAMENRLVFIKKFYPVLVPNMLFSLWKQSYQDLIIAKKNASNDCVCLFSDYWMELNGKYKKEFDTKINKRIEYRLYCHSPKILEIYLWVKVILSRFVPKYQKLSIINEKNIICN